MLKRILFATILALIGVLHAGTVAAQTIVNIPGFEQQPFTNAAGAWVVNAIAAQPDGSESVGKVYLVAPLGLGAFSGHSNEIAILTANQGWYFVPPTAGMLAYVQDSQHPLIYVGTAWVTNATGTFDAHKCGVYSDGVHDDAATLNACLLASSQLGFTTLQVCGPTIISSADITIPSGITLDLCGQTPTARADLNYRLSQFTGGVLVLASNHTITFGDGDASGLVNGTIERGGDSFSPSSFVPVTMRDKLNLVAAFAGTAITIPSTAKAVHLHNLMLLGFTNGVVSNSKGLRWDHLYVDATNCYSITGSADVTHLEDLACISYLTRGGSLKWQIDNITDDGSGHYKLVAEAPVSDIQWKNGDEIYIATTLTGGAQSANGLHTFVCSGTGGNCDVVASGQQGCGATAGCQVADLSSDSKSTPTSFTATWSAGTRPDGTVQPIVTSADLTYVVPGQKLTTAFTCDTGHGVASPFPPGTTVTDTIPSQHAVIPSNAPQCAGTAQTVIATDDAFVSTHRGAEMSSVQRHGVGLYCTNSGGVTIWNLHTYTHDIEVHAHTHCNQLRLSSPSFGENDPLAEDDLTTLLIDGVHAGDDANDVRAENCTLGQHVTKAIVVNSDGGGTDTFVNCGVGTADGHKFGTMLEVDAGKVLFTNGGGKVLGNVLVADGNTFHTVYISKANDGDNYTQVDVGAVLTAVAGDNGLTCTTLPQYTIDAVDSETGSIEDGHESRAGVCSVWPAGSDGSGSPFATTGGHGTGAKLTTDGLVPASLQMANASMANADFYIQTPGGPSFLGVNNTCLIFTACNPVASPQTVGTALYPTTGKELDMMGTISSGSTSFTITSGCNIAAQGQWAYSFFTAAVTKFSAVSCTGDTGTATLSIAATADQLTPGAIAAGRTRYNATSSVIANAGLFKYLNVGSASQGANTWLNQYLWGVDSSEGIAGSVPVYAISPIGQRAGVFASRSSDNTTEGALTTPLVSYALDDNTSTHHPMHALYLVLDRTAAADASRGIEAEFSLHSLQSCTALDPYTINALGDCENLVLDNGLNAHDSPAKASDALHILTNETGGGGMYSAGIIFDQGAMDTGSGTAPAIELPKNFGIQWFRTAGNPAWTIASSANTNTNTLDLGNTAATFSTNVVGTSFATSGDKSAAFWGANGTRFNAMAATYTDTTSSGSAGILPIDSFGTPTIAATNATSYTTVATVYIAGQPVAGTNATLPAAGTYALDVATGNVNIGGAGAKTSIAGFESISGDGIASGSPLLLNGNMFTGGSGSTTLPYMLLKLGNPTPGSSYSTSGTMLGFNGPSGFAGNILDAHVNGGASVFSVSAAGALNATAISKSGVDMSVVSNLTGSTLPTEITGAETSVASASTVDLSAVTTPKVLITGTTNITTFTMPNHGYFIIRFAGSLTLTYNATSLILPGNASIITQANDMMVVTTDGSGNTRVRSYTRAARTPDDGVFTQNLLANPAFDIWQENTTYSMTGKVFIADRWFARANGGAAASRTASRVAGFCVTGGACSQFAVKIQRVAANTDLQASQLVQQVLSADTIPLQGKTLHLSCDVSFGANYSATGTTSVVILAYGTGTDEAYSGASFTTGNATVNFSTLWGGTAGTSAHVDMGTAAVPANATEMAIRIALPAYVGTAGADDSASFTNCNLTATSGDVPFVHPPYYESLRRAEYTYRKSFTYATVPAQNVGAGTGELIFPATKAGAAAELASVQFGANAMRAAPTVTLYNPAAANAQCRDETAAADGTSTSATNINEKGFEITCTGNASTAVGGAIGVHWQADARL